MARNPKFDAFVDNMKEVHDRKNEDYADEGNPYSNFEGAAQVAGVSVDTVFQVLIGVKVERLRQLVSGGKTANHESVDDSILDLANYAALWGSYRQPNGTSPIEGWSSPVVDPTEGDRCQPECSCEGAEVSVKSWPDAQFVGSIYFPLTGEYADLTP